MSDLQTDSIITGDSFEVLADLPEESIHAVVTDPPYALGDSGFMGAEWDNFSDSKAYQKWCEKWASECLRILKPGGHLLAFGGNTRHHRLFSGVEDAGFEIRDTITWHYGSGFPKALDVSKAIDKAAGAEREVVGEHPKPAGNEPGGNSLNMSKVGMPDSADITTPATDSAKQWEGWKTSLKPATEYVVVARKPFDSTVAENMQTHGTGALNIGETRIAVDESETWDGSNGFSECDGVSLEGSVSGEFNTQNSGLSAEGRYPSNVIFDEHQAQALDQRTDDTVSTGGCNPNQSDERHNWKPTDTNIGGLGDAGGVSRYFYTSKASKAERTLNGTIDNAHPTVKPIDLMEYLIKLVTAENQILLDPFCGSGTTCKAAKNLNRRFIGIEKQAKWADVARVRCGLTPNDPSVVRSDESQKGLESF